mmetsp:Transcript_4051/g.5298  ORF Transcript_4051/g.5298 Transcript_4051/m.5298 type:complete len:105 (-) Transcript_4051:213-527(-)
MTAPLEQNELYALSSVLSMCCKETFDAYNEAKKAKTHPKDMQDLMAKVTSCSSAVNEGAHKSCAESLEAVMKCNVENRKNIKQCMVLREALEKCALTNKLGDVA